MCPKILGRGVSSLPMTSETGSRLFQTESSTTTLVDFDSPAGKDHISVCICTYQRPELLGQLLSALAVQRTDGFFRFTCAVVDNDPSASALAVVEHAQTRFADPIRFVVETARNLAIVRNRALKLASGNLYAFIDDDELPCTDWLLQLWRVLHEYQADAVLGPVRPRFERKPPSWLLRSGVCERPSYETGSRVNWRLTRTGNVLLRSELVIKSGIWFDSAYATGGEDVDFFRRAALCGKIYVWCELAPVYEIVPESRMNRRYHLKRALLQGSVSKKYSANRPFDLETLRTLATTILAIAAYTLALPFLFLFGEHHGMKYLIKDCHHVARLLAMLGVPISVRRDF